MERARGIMFSKRAQTPLAILFSATGRRRNAIHSFACPVFDAVFLGENGIVVDKIAKIQPNLPFVFSAKACNMVLELPPGASKKVKLGEKLVLKPDRQPAE